jgi:hypothetical protein
MAVRLSALRAGRPPFTFRKIPGTRFWLRLSRLQGHSAAGRIRSIEKSNDLIGNRAPDLACSIVPQPTTLPRTTSQTAWNEQVAKKHQHGDSYPEKRGMLYLYCSLAAYIATGMSAGQPDNLKTHTHTHTDSMSVPADKEFVSFPSIRTHVAFLVHILIIPSHQDITSPLQSPTG